MKTVTKTQDLREKIRHWKTQHKSIAFVPTMGNLHTGHLALIEKASQLADKVVVSIFVNPTQFDRTEDLHAYPRTLQADQDKLQSVGTNLLFLPSVDVMYPSLNSACTVHVPDAMNILEGASRKGHFSGVATVVAKLFNLVQADTAVFGQKDFQQLMLIRQMVSDLNFDVDIVAAPTVREADGLAMSSRNGYLTKSERAIASGLYKELILLRDAVQQGRKDYKILCVDAEYRLKEKGFIADYIEVCCQKNLQRPKEGDSALVILAAVWLGKARLIDNVAFNVSSS